MKGIKSLPRIGCETIAQALTQKEDDHGIVVHAQMESHANDLLVNEFTFRILESFFPTVTSSR